MTLDRDIRVSADQLVYLERITRDRRNELGRKISRAEANRAAGATIQAGTLQRHYEELGELSALLETFEVARRQIQHQVRERLETERVRGVLRELEAAG